jgi:ABC-2 type transport system permease protein
LRGPVRRALGELLPAALAWGVGIGIYGLLIAMSSRSFADQLRTTSDATSMLRSLFPSYDITTTGGVLEASFMVFGYVLAGFAATTLVRGWATDESVGRLEMLLASPLTRGRWAIAGGVGVYLAIAAVTLVVAVAVGTGAAAAGDVPATPVVGTLALGMYAAGLAGVGVAVGGLISTALAGPVVAGLSVTTFLVDVLAPALELPGWIRQLALSARFGQPMAGRWDWVGIVASLVLALGGLVLGGWGNGTPRHPTVASYSAS